MTRRRETLHIHQLKRTYNKQTNTFTYNITYQTTPTTQTQRTQTVAEAFGLGNDQTQTFTLYDNTQIKIKPTDIVLITGDSGSGKSALLKAISQDLGTQAQDTKTLNINPNTPIIETVGKTTTEALETLSKVGLNDAFLFLRTYAELSDGQKHRYHIAKLTQTAAQFWILDEFTSTLDRDTAKIVAYNLQKLARQSGKAVIAATTHNDLVKDLTPNVHIHKQFGKQVTIKYHPKAKTQQCSLLNQIHTQQGTFQDYKTLSTFHYRTAKTTAPKKIFTLKRKNQTIAAIVYSHPPPLCFGRSRAWKGNLTELNQQVSTITRIVVHPKFRSIGLGTKLVKETLPLAGTSHVETIAVMAKYNPFFEKAGMQKIAQSAPSKHVTQTLQQLEQLGFETAILPNTAYTEKQINQTGPEKIRTLLTTLSQNDSSTRKRLAKLPNIYPKHTEFTQKLATYNTADLAAALKRLSFIAQPKIYLFYTQNQTQPT